MLFLFVFSIYFLYPLYQLVNYKSDKNCANNLFLVIYD
jgi:hypothetical protein